ncbi:hypothetical protein HNP84_003674 [Thermocatellispora tengchongensis]|uniref:Heavy metal transporter n=1 Tax=Thermocatellispora tengchongensis TaxID=1073253 RepID=A0A840P2N7_9ACTN|nr:hypothetical protein [Thermocatellispora tengchongensis]MBB5133948.1 hypothetical protein [Thermocatellispora tengchongensis]
MRRRFSRTTVTITAIVVVLAVLIGFGVYKLLQSATTYTAGERCQVTTPRGTINLEIEQAEITATIAAVAERRRLPMRAVVIALATGLQESKLRNLPFGDRDSLGIFQQRPSQGWGEPEQLLDPVYATNRFFAALVKVKGYRTMPLHEAAQAVQLSADGTAYAQHEGDATILAEAFTGRVPKAVHCWFPPPEDETPAPPQPDKARRELVRALGATAYNDGKISARSSRRGWLIAAWSVAHAQEYGLRRVRYAGLAWSADGGQDGWLDDAEATPRHVQIT